MTAVSPNLGNTKDRGRPALFFAPDDWAAFLDGVRTGEFDLPS